MEKRTKYTASKVGLALSLAPWAAIALLFLLKPG